MHSRFCAIFRKALLLLALEQTAMACEASWAGSQISLAAVSDAEFQSVLAGLAEGVAVDTELRMAYSDYRFHRDALDKSFVARTRISLIPEVYGDFEDPLNDVIGARHTRLWKSYVRSTIELDDRLWTAFQACVTNDESIAELRRAHRRNRLMQPQLEQSLQMPTGTMLDVIEVFHESGIEHSEASEASLMQYALDVDALLIQLQPFLLNVDEEPSARAALLELSRNHNGDELNTAIDHHTSVWAERWKLYARLRQRNRTEADNLIRLVAVASPDDAAILHSALWSRLCPSAFADERIPKLVQSVESDASIPGDTRRAFESVLLEFSTARDAAIQNIESALAQVIGDEASQARGREVSLMHATGDYHAASSRLGQDSLDAAIHRWKEQGEKFLARLESLVP